MRWIAMLLLVSLAACASRPPPPPPPQEEALIEIEVEECDYDLAQDYADEVTEAIDAVWQKRVDPTITGKASILIRLEADGSLRSAVASRRSAPELAETALAAAREASPFRAPPAGRSCIEANTPIRILLMNKPLRR